MTAELSWEPEARGADHEESRWRAHAGAIAWPTVGLTVAVWACFGAVGAGYLSGMLPGWLAFAVNAVLIYAAFTPLHEAAHGNVAGAHRGAAWLETLVGWSTSTLLCAPYPAFRVLHLEHHAHTNDPEHDPDHWVAGARWWSVMARCWTILPYYYATFLGGEAGRTEAGRRARPAVILGTLALASVLAGLTAAGYGWEALVLWVGPAWLASGALAFAFDWLPHYPHALQERFRDTRVMLVPGLTLPMLWQNFHLIHHLYPRVPFYRYQRCFDDLRPWLERQGAPIESFSLGQPRPLCADMTTPAAALGALEAHITALERPTPDSVTLRLQVASPDALPSALPGQHVRLGVRIDGALRWRCYSLIEPLAPNNQLAVTIKRVPNGRVSSWAVEDAKVGAKLYLRGPQGRFAWSPDDHPDDAPLVLIGGGSGITPLRHILLAAQNHTNTPPTTLLYGNRSPNAAIFGAELDALGHAGRLRYRPVYEDRAAVGAPGRLDADRIEAELSALNGLDLTRARFYICGPSPMMDAAQDALARLGVPPAHVHQERFVAAPTTKPALDDDGTRFTVRLQRGGREVTLSVGAHETILDAALRQDVALKHSCRQGVCGTCVLRLRGGDLDRGHATALLDGEAEAGYFLACTGRARSDLDITDAG